MEKALFDQPIVLRYDVKPKYRLISRKFSGLCLPTKSQAGLYPFDKPIKSPYFRSFFFSILLARFRFKVIVFQYYDVIQLSIICSNQLRCEESSFPLSLKLSNVVILLVISGFDKLKIIETIKWYIFTILQNIVTFSCELY